MLESVVIAAFIAAWIYYKLRPKRLLKEPE